MVKHINKFVASGPTVTVSVGLLTAYPDMESRVQEFMMATDSLLYAAKMAGRDHIEYKVLNG